MDYLKTYKSFVNSHYLSEGVRITVGVLIPAFLMSYFNMFSSGIAISLGALFVSIADSAGPIHHRRNGMLVCIASLFLISLATSFLQSLTLPLAIFILAASFFFSMIGIYGARAGSIGTATLIILTLSTDRRLNLHTNYEIIRHSLLIASGGLWYMCFSMILYTVRPYKIVQQALGDYLQSISQYLSKRAELYSKDVNYENTFKQLLQQQIAVQSKQTELAEMLFKTRSIVKESTATGRALVMIHLDAGDIFERIMMSHQEYTALHDFFDETGVLITYRELAKELAKTLDEVGIAVKSGEEYTSGSALKQHIDEARKQLDDLRLQYLKPENIEGFISLRRILENIQDLAERLSVITSYTRPDAKLKKVAIDDDAYGYMISSQEISPRIFFDNLTLKSDTFRHSLRVSVAMGLGYIITLFLNSAHSYWVLLTIVVILKPAFSLTKQRNRDRIGGTLAGIIIGVAILLATDNKSVIVAFLVLFMVGSYTFLRVNYFVAVLLMTPYLVLFYHLLNPLDFKALLADRVIDTLIGSLIAFIASTFLFPAWEREKIKPAMADMLNGLKEYFLAIADSVDKKNISPHQLKAARKTALVALANLSDVFSRMLSEPRTQQRGIELIHQFVVLSHILTSYVATLSYYIHSQVVGEDVDKFSSTSGEIEKMLTNAVDVLDGRKADVFEDVIETLALQKVSEEAESLLEIRKKELEAGLMETKTRRSLFNLKSVSDVIRLIYTGCIDINKIARKIADILEESQAVKEDALAIEQ